MLDKCLPKIFNPLKHELLFNSGRLTRPCTIEGLLVTWTLNGRMTSDGTQLKDRSTSATHEAMQGQSVLFSGSQYGTVDLTGHEHLNEEVWTIEFEFYNSVAIDAATTGQQIIQIGSDDFLNGPIFGAFTGAITDEILSIASGAAVLARSSYAHATESIAIGKHIARFQWNGSGYDIYLDGLQVNNASSGTQVVLVLDELILGNGLANLNNTALYNITLKNEAGTVIWQNYLAGGPDATDTELSVVGPDVSWSGFTWPTNRIQSALYGSKKHNELGYSVGVTDNVEYFEAPFSDIDVTDLGDGDFLVAVDGGSRRSTTLVVGNYYTATFTISGYVSGVAGISGSTTTDANKYPNANGTFTIDFIHDGSNPGYLRFVSTVAGVTFSDISVEQLPQGYIPASLDNPSQDIYGNALTYSGRAAQPLDVFGYTVGWDGATSAELDSAVTLSGDFRSVSLVNTSGGINRALWGGDSDTEGWFRITSIGTPGMMIDGNSYIFSSLSIPDNTDILVDIKRVGTDLIATVGEESETINSVSTANIIVRYLGVKNINQSRFTGLLPRIKFYNASNVLTNHWVIESGSQLNQSTIYDVVGGNHATLSGHTTPAFDTLFQPSYLAQNGGEVSGQNIIPYPLGTNTFNGIHDAPEDTFRVKSLPTVEIEEADLTGIFINKTTGATNYVDPYDLVDILYYQWKNSTDFLLYNEDISGTCRGKTEKYLGK